jgi:predicted ATPase
MSPEQARAEPVGSATDIFALGIVLYELTTGRHPFDADTPLSTLYAIATQPVLPPARLNPEIPAALDALILQMLEKDPQRRPTAAEVETALRELVGRGAGADLVGAALPGRRQTVGREQERAALWAGFESAAAGGGLLLCVTGEPGIGKTTLVEDFLAELADGEPAWCVARGRCSERLAGAEAYLPVLEALDSLLRGTAGEAAARALRLAAPTWYAQLVPPAPGDAAGETLAARARAASQERMRHDLLAFLKELSRRRPLVLFLDDVHWADVSTANLLAYLGARCDGLRLLLLVTCRPTELLLSRHPFGQVKEVLHVQGACREILLGFLSRQDIDAYLAQAFPGHAFAADFASLVYARTEGNPLFMADLLRYLRERKVIAEEGGRWGLARAVPDLRRELPESVRGLIQRKLDHLDETDRRLLSAASVQGHEFDSAVAARVLGMGAAEAEERLEALDRIHGLVRLRREQEFPDGTLSLRYQFVHVLYQNALYAALQPARRTAWSAAVAQALLGHHGGQGAAAAGELALLFEAARDWARAADYFCTAAENAARVYANQEAVVLARRGLALLDKMPDTPQKAQQELRLQMALTMPLQTTRGYASPEAGQACNRARALCEQLGESVARFPVLWRLALFYMIRDEQQTARALAEQCLRLAHGVQDPGLLLEAHLILGTILVYLAEFPLALEHLERVVALYDPRRDASHTFVYGNHPVVIAHSFAAWVLWLLGYPDQALDSARQALALAEETSHPLTLANAHFFALQLHRLRREASRTLEHCQALIALAGEQGIHLYVAAGQIWHGWALARQGQPAEGIEQMRQAIVDFRATGTKVLLPHIGAMLAETLVEQGQLARGQAALAEALAEMHAGSDRSHEAELYRLQGEFLLRQEPAALAQAEAWFRQALATARRQGAKSFELRAVMSLVRLLRQQGQQAEGGRLLAEAYGGFTEGWDTADLREARDLLKKLA